MSTLTIILSEHMMRKLGASAERLWPGQGMQGMLRLIRDAIRRYVRYSDGDSGSGNRG